ncbi:AmmeMemoRadiSam system protein B [Candidatus Nomurabacteria bacterium]|nr:AmmeMemoRadiSam system protein B [Candidatus Nomurabacteria bacterium]
MIVFASFVPHSPLLIPEVGKNNLAQLQNTVDAYQKLEQDIYAAKPDVIFLIARHADILPASFSINQRPEINIDFKKFGDLVTKIKIDNDIALGYQIKEAVETSMPITLTSQELLDYSAGVPLYYLTRHLPKIKVVPISYSSLDNQKHFDFGKHLKEMANRSGKRVAIIAAGDLSHKLHQDSPAGYSPRAQEFDQQLMKDLNENKIDDLLNLERSFVEEVSAIDGFYSLLILLGAIKNLNYRSDRLSYQAPFGIGYLVQNFKLR